MTEGALRDTGTAAPLPLETKKKRKKKKKKKKKKEGSKAEAAPPLRRPFLLRNVLASIARSETFSARCALPPAQLALSLSGSRDREGILHKTVVRESPGETRLSRGGRGAHQGRAGRGEREGRKSKRNVLSFPDDRPRPLHFANEPELDSGLRGFQLAPSSASGPSAQTSTHAIAGSGREC